MPVKPNLLGYISSSFSLGKSAKYLDHVIDAEGLHTTPEKLKAILEAPAAKNLNQLKCWLMDHNKWNWPLEHCVLSVSKFLALQDNELSPSEQRVTYC